MLNWCLKYCPYNLQDQVTKLNATAGRGERQCVVAEVVKVCRGHLGVPWPPRCVVAEVVKVCRGRGGHSVSWPRWSRCGVAEVKVCRGRGQAARPTGAMRSEAPHRRVARGARVAATPPVNGARPATRTAPAPYAHAHPAHL